MRASRPERGKPGLSAHSIMCGVFLSRAAGGTLCKAGVLASDLTSANPADPCRKQSPTQAAKEIWSVRKALLDTLNVIDCEQRRMHICPFTTPE